MENEKISVVVPCFNEELVIFETYTRLVKVMTENHYPTYEFIFINDGSRDKTLHMLTELSSRDEAVKVISFSRNFGHEAAVTAGLNHTTGDLVFIIDADLQDPPELFPEMISLLKKEKADMVYGVRHMRKGETFLKKLTSKAFYRIMNFLSDVNIPKDVGDFRLINRRLVSEYRKLTEKNKFTRGLISWLGFKQVPFLYERQSRFSGSSKYNYSRLLRLATTAIFYFSKKPLLLAINLGFFCVLGSILFSAYVFWGKFTSPLPGWASTLLIIIFFGGIQLLTVGVLGIYIGNIFDEVKNRPEYIVDKMINIDTKL